VKRVCLVVMLAAIAARPSVEAAGPVFKRGPATCHAIAFTFDLCPVNEGAGFDAPLVSYLIEHHVPATFFASGRWIETHDADLRRLIAQPFFEVGTHGEAHAHMPKLSAAAQAAEVAGPIQTLLQHYHLNATLFRPPYGEYNDTTVHVADAAGQTTVMWSIVSGDPDKKLTTAAIVDDVVGRAKNGSVIIFHANGRGWHTKEILPLVYARLVTTKGFAPKTISGLRAGCSSTGALR